MNEPAPVAKCNCREPEVVAQWHYLHDPDCIVHGSPYSRGAREIEKAQLTLWDSEGFSNAT